MKKLLILFINGLFLFQSCLILPSLNPVSHPKPLSQVSPGQETHANWQASDLEIQVSRRCFDLVNNYRAKKGLARLIWHDSIATPCFEHSRNMGQGKIPMSHQGFDQRVNQIGKKIAWNSVAENVAYNWNYSDPAQKAVEGWIKSPGHKANMLGDYSHSALGAYKNSDNEWYFTQIFIKKP